MRKTINTSNGAFKAQFATVIRLSDELLDAEKQYEEAFDKEVKARIIAKKAQELAVQIEKLHAIGVDEVL